MKIYKLKHIPTGLYFTSSRGKGNLSKTGKIYTIKPSLVWVKTIRIKIYSWKDTPSKYHRTIIDYFKLDWNNGCVDKYVKTDINDWIIEEL